MTLLFCDLVGSSRLAARLDPEDFAALLVAYRERCAAAVVQNGGWMSGYSGDGVIACFGYPRAMGREAQAAVNCALAIAQEVSALAGATRLPGGSELAVRIGIETGLVVAGRLGPAAAMEVDAFVGTVPNTAARLQGLAEPNGVVIGEATHELVHHEFDCEELPAERLVHLQPPVRAFAVRGEAKRRGRRLVLNRRDVPLIGRSAPLGLLRERWARAAEGQGQTVLLSGEAGIGKSRLAQELVDHITAAPHALTVLACAPHASGTAFYPALAALRDELATAVEHAGSKLGMREALAARFAAIGNGNDDTVAVIAEALGLGTAPTDLAPAVRRHLLLHGLQAWLLHPIDDDPLLIVAEDLHWSDPSLLELLQGLSELLPASRVMLLATYRSEFVLSWPDRPTTLRMTLPPLDRHDAERLLNALARHDTTETREAILARSDGVPLFLEEFTLAAYTPAVPRTLQQLFTARLDGLAETKRLAQCAAILAPHIEPDLLASLAGLPVGIVDSWLKRLVNAELLMRTGVPSAYTFRHALLQQAASESILLAERRALHARAAAVLANLRPELAEHQPEELAQHHVLAGEFSAAVPLYARAARRALAGAALEEAESQARRGLEAAAALSPPDAKAELELRVLLGQVLIARLGYASARVQETFEEALGAAEQVRDQTHAVPALRGLASFYQVRGPLSRAEAICSWLVAAAERADEPCMLVDAWRRRGWNHGCMGRMAEAEEDLARALEAFDATRVEEHIAVAGHDPRVVALANLCWLAPAYYGLIVAEQRAQAAAAAAGDSRHPVSACYGLLFAALVLQQAKRLDHALSLAERALELAGEKGLAYWVAVGKVAVGYDQVIRRKDAAAGRDAIRLGLASYRETQGELLRPFILSLLAEAEVALGDFDAAQRAMGEALDVAIAIEAKGFVPELLLRQAQLCEANTATESRELFERALAAARAQGAEAVASTASLKLHAH